MSRGRVFVTGGTGFTGGHLCRRLIREGFSVSALVRDPHRASALRCRGVEIVRGDLRDLKTLRLAIRGIDVVYHIGASFRQERVSRQEMWNVNVEGTRNVLQAAVEAGVDRFVHCSTVGVHGDVKKPPATEETPYSPGDHYQQSKTEAEKVVMQEMAKGRLPIVVFRPGGIYGPHDMRFLKLFRAVQNRRFVMLGSGRVIYQMVYIDDLIDGILLCGTHEIAPGNIYILTGDEPVTLNHLVAVVAAELGRPAPRFHFPVTPVYVAGLFCELVCRPFGIEPPLYRRRVDFFRKTRSFDIAKAKRELGYSPAIRLDRGIKFTADWYRQRGYL